MSIKYVIDFDGTIINVWERFYHVFFDSIGISPVCSCEAFKRKKLHCSDDFSLATSFGLCLSDSYFDIKHFKLESIDYLIFDQLIIISNILKDFFKKNDAIILTKRRNYNNFLWEMRYLGINSLVEQSIVLDPDLKITKMEYLSKNFNAHDRIVIVGDSLEEIEASKLDNVSSVFVKTGLFDPPKNLLDNKSVLIYDSLYDYINYLNLNYEI